MISYHRFKSQGRSSFGRNIAGNIVGLEKIYYMPYF